MQALREVGYDTYSVETEALAVTLVEEVASEGP